MLIPKASLIATGEEGQEPYDGTIQFVESEDDPDSVLMDGANLANMTAPETELWEPSFESLDEALVSGRIVSEVYDRFVDKILVGVSPPKDDVVGRCWRWTAAKQNNGYGVFRMEGRTKRAHRVAYEWLVGPIPDGLEIDHLCRNRACVNPSHMEPVTRLENVRRGDAMFNGSYQRSKTHCPSGHAYDDANTALREADGSRRCKQCDRDYQRRQRERHRRG